jgi:aminopeptidase N
MDPNSLANINEVVTNHIFWDIQKVDFQNHVLHAVATLHVEGVSKNPATRLVLDTKELEILGVTENGKDIKVSLTSSEKFQNE